MAGGDFHPTMRPTLSAVIPTYNRARFLPIALKSIFQQTQPVDEIIVVDDGSTDDTAQLLGSYGDSIRWIRQENAGPGAARNRGMQEARCDYIAFLDSDDIWCAEKTALQLAFLKQHPEIDFLFGDMAIFTPTSDNNEPEIKTPAIHEYCVTHAADLKNLFEYLLVENFIPTSSIIYRRSCVDRMGFFDQSLKIAEDLEYWIRISLRCHCGFVNAVVEKRCRHEGNLINDWAECNRSHAQVLTRVLETDREISPHARKVIGEKLASLYYDLGSFYLKRRAFATGYSYLRLGKPRHTFDWKRAMKLSVAAALRGLG